MLLAQPSPSDQRLTDLKNISYETAGRLNKVGIRTAEEFLSGNPYDIFEAMLRKDPKTNKKRILASLVGAYKGTHWNSVFSEAQREYKMRRPDHLWD
jgi:hypothetical protein